MAPFLFFLELPSVCVPSEESLSPCLSISKKKKKTRCRGDEAGRDEAVGAPASEERFEARNSDSNKKKKISHFHCQFSSKNTRTRLTSPPLWSQGAMQIHKPLHFFSPPLCFPSTPLRQSCRPPRPIVLNTSSPSLVDYMTEPRLPSCCSYSLRGWGGGGRNDKSYLQVTVGNSEIQDVEKFKLFCSFSFFLSFSLSPCFL